MDSYNDSNIQSWVNSRMLRGYYTFSKSDLRDFEFSISAEGIKRSLSRLERNGTIMSPWQNFYVTIPTEYKLRGIVPPLFYIDRLMQFLGRDYYVSLLSAAELNGASHQRAMVFQVTMSGASVRSGIKNGTKIEFHTKKEIPLQFTNKVKTKTGYITVSGPELTALDVVAEHNKVGGLSRAAEIVLELCEKTNWDGSKLQLLEYFKTPTIQRLGYILDLLEQTEQADALFALMTKAGIKARKVPLKPEMQVPDEANCENRWKIIENYTLEIDDI